MIILSGAVPASWLAARAEIGSRAGRSASCVTRTCRIECIAIEHDYAPDGLLARGSAHTVMYPQRLPITLGAVLELSILLLSFGMHSLGEQSCY
jgi:hypothetical protein